MKKLKLIAVLSATLVSYVLPIFIAQAGTDPLIPPLALVHNSAKILYLRVTAYTSSPEETDDTPFITANGTVTHDGIVATNLLPFGTKVMIPALFGSKVFTVEDRMAPRKKNTMDIWMPSKGRALFFGVNYANVVVLEKATASVLVAEK
jgi:3D (Asp-Asp-Asp) domain-containing protein